ncbi:MAG: AMP-binding protein [Treponema sp.]|jgi:acetyl-CoA synthetase|nr:AMP-binding protein [Treponema sp.]
MNFLDTFLQKKEFESYEDLYANYKVTVPGSFNFAWDVMDQYAAKNAGARAMLWCDEKGAEAVFTFGDIKKLSNQAANTFIAAGIKKGDPVMLILKRHWEYWPALLALHKIGAIAIPATHLLTSKDIVYRCKAAGILGIVCIDEEKIMGAIDDADAKLRAGGSALRLKAFMTGAHGGGGDKAQGENWTDFKSLMEKADAELKRPEAVNTNADIMLLYFTSGTTGMPKMVQHNYIYPLGHITTARFWHQVEEGGLHITVADTGWAKAAWGKIYGQWICGAALFVYDYDRFVPHEMLSVISKHKVCTFCAPPTVYRFFVKEDLKKYDFSALKNCTVAGEPLEPEIYERFKEGTGIKLRECYGQTELTVTVCTYPWMEPKPGSMGRPAPGYDLDLLREDGTSCDTGEEGQLVVRTSNAKPLGMFDGYYRDRELTASVWHDGIYYTGDMAWRDEDGYLWFVGRSDDVIKSSGYRIGPFEVESALVEHPAVLECAITGVPDPDRGAVVKATVVLAKGWAASEELKKELQNHVKKITAPYKYPRIVEFAAELPKTISGKIRRVEIREKEEQH